jgi:hypothetical protein
MREQRGKETHASHPIPHLHIGLVHPLLEDIIRRDVVVEDVR